MSSSERLKFIVAPHIVEDLGLNLYTTLPRVLVEYVANAHDADAGNTQIILDKEAINKARDVVKAEWELECAKAGEEKESKVKRLAARTLPEYVQIIIEDSGHGMSRTDIQKKFLIAGRRRRDDDKTMRSPMGRILMGRKGLGKLAGFGVAKKITIISRKKGETHATKITLDYNELIKKRDTNDIRIEEDFLPDGGGFTESGTKVFLSQLLYEPMKAQLSTIEHHIADHFSQINQNDFEVTLNGDPIKPSERDFVYSWPLPEKGISGMIENSYNTDDGKTFTFSYRIRFTGDRKALSAKDRGIRIYAHNRLASAPSLLDADTNMHGFRMTDYLDGIVYADFIDDQPEDYIATDRQALRWESPLLQPMYEILSLAIKEACKSRQGERDKEKTSEVLLDKYTNDVIEKAFLNKKQQTMAFKIASALASTHKKGVEDNGYKTKFHQVVKGIGQGEILTALSALAAEEKPALDRVIAEITKLTAEELDGFLSFAKGRISGIKALRKIVTTVDFKKSNNEDQLHKLLEKCPWLIDATYFEFITSNKSEKTMFTLIEKELKIGKHVEDKYDKTIASEVDPGRKNKRPDLVFLLGNDALSRIVIVELKAPNTPLHGEHYRQLQKYVRNTEKWLQSHQRVNVDVQGILIGSRASISSHMDDVEWLDDEIKKNRNQGQIRVFGIDELLENSELAHNELLKLQENEEDN